MQTTLSVTVFTSTYNRGHLLGRVFESLTSQTCQDFEWLIIDDGSTDDTENIVNCFIRASPFPINYVKIQNSGKHNALNLVPSLAKASLFLVVDSDHRLFPKAIERMLAVYRSISEEILCKFSGVSCLAVDQNYLLIGEIFNAADANDDYAEKILRHTRLAGAHYKSFLGDKLELVKVSILKEYPFPRVSAQCLPESYFVHRYAAKYRTICFNEIHGQFHVNEESNHLSALIGAPDNFLGNLYYFLAWLQYSYRLFPRKPLFFLVIARAYFRTARFAGFSLVASIERVEGLIPRLILLFGLVFFFISKPLLGGS